jgi:hypothetical protein
MLVQIFPEKAETCANKHMLSKNEILMQPYF